MKKLILALFLSAIFLFSASNSYAQACPTCGPDEDPIDATDPGGDPDIPVPIDNGILFLLAGGLVYGTKLAIDKKRNAQA